MSKHTHHETKNAYQSSGAKKSEDMSTRETIHNDDVKLRAYQIHQEKGGSDLDNWLEAEQSVKSTSSH